MLSFTNDDSDENPRPESASPAAAARQRSALEETSPTDLAIDVTGSPQSSSSKSVLVELLWPTASNGFTRRNLAESQKILEQVATPNLIARVGRADFVSQRIATVKENADRSTSSNEDTETLQSSDPTLTYPVLRAASAAWRVAKSDDHLAVSTSGGNGQFPGSREMLKQESILVQKSLQDYEKQKDGTDDASPYISLLLNEAGEDNAVTLIAQAERSIYLLSGSDGAKFGVLLYCIARAIGSPIEHCDRIRFAGNYGRAIISADGRYLAVADLAGLGQPGLHVHDLVSRKRLEVDVQPVGGTSSIEFERGTSNLFARTPYGILAYSLGDTARLSRRYQLAARPTLGSEDVVDYEPYSLAISSKHIYALSRDGVVQALLRESGRTDWLVSLQGKSSNGIALSPDMKTLAIHDDDCMKFLHAGTGTRFARPLCLRDFRLEPLPKSDTPPERISGVKFDNRGGIRKAKVQACEILCFTFHLIGRLSKDRGACIQRV